MGFEFAAGVARPGGFSSSPGPVSGGVVVRRACVLARDDVNRDLCGAVFGGDNRCWKAQKRPWRHQRSTRFGHPNSLENKPKTLGSTDGTQEGFGPRGTRQNQDWIAPRFSTAIQKGQPTPNKRQRAEKENRRDHRHWL